MDEEILKTLGIPQQMLPRIVPSSDSGTWGVTLKDGPLGARVPVYGALGDQQAALLGQTCFNVGEAKNTYGTGCFLLLNTGHKPVISNQGLLTTLGYQINEQAPVYCLEGSIAIAGALVQWLRDNLGLISSASEIEDLSKTVQDNGGAYFVPAFSGLFAPYWRSDARGVIVGLTRYVKKGHIAFYIPCDYTSTLITTNATSYAFEQEADTPFLNCYGQIQKYSLAAPDRSDATFFRSRFLQHLKYRLNAT